MFALRLLLPVKQARTPRKKTPQTSEPIQHEWPEPKQRDGLVVLILTLVALAETMLLIWLFT